MMSIGTESSSAVLSGVMVNHSMVAPSASTCAAVDMVTPSRRIA
jgi:hypothetical protein